jgi:nitrogenase delta subunit
MDETMKEKIEILTDYIMHRCLWQFHSRAWDRERQNANILGVAKQLLLGEKPDLSTPELKCYWLDGFHLAKGFRERFDWVNQMSKEEIVTLMDGLKERMDYLTIHGSLNKELTVAAY